MLGGIDQNWVYQLVIALLKQDSQGLMSLSQEIASYAPSYSRLFAELIQLFHQIALLQIVEQHFDLPADLLALQKKFSKTMSAEDVQLYYQISLNGRKDLPYAFDEQAAFDMTLLRLLAFKPMQKSPLTSGKSIGNVDNKEQLNNIDFSEVNWPKTTGLAHNIDKAAIEENAESQTEAVTPDYIVATDNIQKDSLQKTEQIESTELNEQVEKNQLNQLSEQMLAIEQQATELNHQELEPLKSASPQSLVTQHAGSVNVSSVEQVSPAENYTQQQKSPAIIAKEQAGQLSIDSPVGSVLATRNMLRSRKKALEKQAKKSSDATMRHANHGDRNTHRANVPVEPEVVAPESLVITPEPEVAFHQDNIDPAKITKANQVDKWAHMIDSMQLTARVRQLAINATISEDSTDDNLILKLNQATRHLNTEFAQQQLQTYICEFLSRDITVTLDIVEETVADPYQIQVQINDKRLEYAKTLLKEDPVVIALQDTFQASMNEESISPR